MRTVRCSSHLGGGVCPGGVCHTPPCEQNHRYLWKHYLASTTLRTVKMLLILVHLQQRIYDFPGAVPTWKHGGYGGANLLFCQMISKTAWKWRKLGWGCLPGCVCPGGVSGQGVCTQGGVCPGGVCLAGVSAGGVCLGGPTHLWTESQTPVKTLPCRNYVADGNSTYCILWSSSQMSMRCCLL